MQSCRAAKNSRLHKSLRTVKLSKAQEFANTSEEGGAISRPSQSVRPLIKMRSPLCCAEFKKNYSEPSRSKRAELREAK
jgi:hypothetical protein